MTQDGDMRRREFLGKTAALAGLAGVATALPLDTLLSQAAKVQAQRSRLPSPRNMPIDTFVVLMMENRSFDHYFGWHPDADGDNQLVYPDDNGDPHPTHPLAPDFQGCGFGDPDHSWEGSRTQYNGGKLDGFRKSPNDEFAIGYYVKDDLPYIPHVADAFTLYDRYFCSILGPTFPNRHYQWSAQSGGQITNVLPPPDLGDSWETIFDRAMAQGVTAKYYAPDQPFGLLYGARAIPWVHPIEQYFADAAAGELPNIAFVDPPFLDGGGGDGLSGDEHPHGDIRIGQAYVGEVTNAFVASPNFERGAMFINYDEGGGFFDHVSPVFVPDDRESKNLDENFGVTGYRIPGVAVSPYAPRGVVNHMTLTHESILKLISYRFRLGYLNKRHRYASNIGYSFDWENPNLDDPGLPSPLPPVTTACSLQAGAAAETKAMEEQEEKEGAHIGSPEFREYLDRLGYDAEPAKPEDIFPNNSEAAARLRSLWSDT